MPAVPIMDADQLVGWFVTPDEPGEGEFDADYYRDFKPMGFITE